MSPPISPAERRDALLLLADICISVEKADTFARHILPSLTLGARWGHVETIRTLHERWVALDCALAEPTSIRMWHEDADAHRTRDIRTALDHLTAAVEAAIEADRAASGVIPSPRSALRPVKGAGR